MCPRVSSLPTLPYAFQATISTPLQQNLLVTIPANQTAISVIHELQFPVLWTRQLTEQINSQIKEERKKKVNALLNKWIGIPHESQESLKKHEINENSHVHLEESQTQRESELLSQKDEIKKYDSNSSQDSDINSSISSSLSSTIGSNGNEKQNVNKSLKRGNLLSNPSKNLTKNFILLHENKEQCMFHHYFKNIFFCNPQTQNHLIKIEQQMALVYKDSLNDSKKEIEGMRHRHSEEMNKLFNSDNSTVEGIDSLNIDVAKIVNSQMTQITQLEQKWNQALLDLKSQQIKQFRKFVKDLFEQVIQDITDREGITTLLDTLNISNKDFRDKVWRINNTSNIHSEVVATSLEVSTFPETPSSSNEHQQHIINRYTNAISSYLKKQKMKPAYSNISQAKEDKKINSKQIKNEEQIVKFPRVDFSYPSFLEKKNACKFNICIDQKYYDEFSKNPDNIPQEGIINLYIVTMNDFADALSQFSTDSELEHRSKNLGDLYRNKLNAFIIDCVLNKNDNKLLWHSTEYRKIQYHTSQTQAPDLHFADISTQLQQIQESISELESGDYFVTKHSNLAWIHLVFHLITTQTASNNPIHFHKKTMFGLENIFEDCYRLGVKNLFIPIPLANIPLNPQLDIRENENISNEKMKSQYSLSVHKEAMMQLQDVLQRYWKRIKDLRTEENFTTNPLKNLVVFMNQPTKGNEESFNRQISFIVQSVFDKYAKQMEN